MKALPLDRRPRPADPAARRVLAAVVALALFRAAVPAQEAGDPGLVLPVPVPITTEGVSRLGRAADDAIDRYLKEDRGHDRPFRLIYDFNPDGLPSSGNEFGPCYDLFKQIRGAKARGAYTVAYVHKSVTRHSVLPVLACHEIAFSPEGKLGDIVEPGKTLDPELVVLYEKVAGTDEAPGTSYPPAVILKMLDRELVLVEAKPAEYLQQHRPRYRAQSKTRPHERVVLGAGEPGLYDARLAQNLELCRKLVGPTVREVIEEYQLRPSALDPVLARTPVAWVLPVEGLVTPPLKERMKRRIGRALGAGANLLILHLKCHGGDSLTANDLADYIARLNDERRDNPVKTVAYVAEGASDTALFLALACQQIVMAPRARLGDFDDYLREHPDRVEVIRQNLTELAGRRRYPEVLVRGMVDRDLYIAWVVPRKGGGGGRPMDRRKFERDQESLDPQWKSEEDKTIKPADGRCLTLNADDACWLGLARDKIDSLDGVYKREGVERSQVTVAGSDWLDDLADFLRHPWTSMILVMAGVTCLILELKMPGVGLPGVIAAVCFVLFFWSQSRLHDQMMWLAVLLFLLGLVLLAIEVFILPGFGVCGVSGVLLVVGSLGLVAYGQWPRDPQEWSALGRTMGPFGLGILGAAVAAFLLARFLPSIPYANRLILTPAGETEGVDGEFAPDTAAGSELTGLLGAIGVAATPLRPAGKAQFGDDFIDVVAEGSYVPPGSRVRVIEIEGNRVVVKEV